MSATGDTIDKLERKLAAVVKERDTWKMLAETQVQDAVFSRRKAAREAGLDEQTDWTEIVQRWRQAALQLEEQLRAGAVAKCEHGYPVGICSNHKSLADWLRSHLRVIGMEKYVDATAIETWNTIEALEIELADLKRRDDDNAYEKRTR